MTQFIDNLECYDEMEDIEDIEVLLLLQGIYLKYGLDFREYSLSSIKRRIKYRLNLEKLGTVSELQAKVLHNPKYMEQLFNDFSINVTEMFRDPRFFMNIRQKLIPALKEYPQLRIWHAGCSTGEEVYSMAILLYEAGLLDRTTIYATDMNGRVLEIAETMAVSLMKMKQYTTNYLSSGGGEGFSQYYSVEGDQAIFHPWLKKSMVFAQHNLVTDGSFNDFHLIICRNVLIYFNRALQNRVLTLFKESLVEEGFLGLGDKEGVAFTNHAKCFEEIEQSTKLYRKISQRF